MNNDVSVREKLSNVAFALAACLLFSLCLDLFATHRNGVNSWPLYSLLWWPFFFCWWFLFLCIYTNTALLFLYWLARGMMRGVIDDDGISIKFNPRLGFVSCVAECCAGQRSRHRVWRYLHIMWIILIVFILCFHYLYALLLFHRMCLKILEACCCWGSFFVCGVNIFNE